MTRLVFSSTAELSGPLLHVLETLSAARGRPSARWPQVRAVVPPPPPQGDGLLAAKPYTLNAVRGRQPARRPQARRVVPHPHFRVTGCVGSKALSEGLPLTPLKGDGLLVATPCPTVVDPCTQLFQLGHASLVLVLRGVMT